MTIRMELSEIQPNAAADANAEKPLAWSKSSPYVAENGRISSGFDRKKRKERKKGKKRKKNSEKVLNGSRGDDGPRLQM